MPDARISTIVRVSLKSIGEEIRETHRIPQRFSGATVDGSDLLLTFGEDSVQSLSIDPRTIPTSGQRVSPRRRRHSSRNRMKTRGWNVVTKMVNSKGQTVGIYEPFVTALRGQKLSKSDQRKRVIEILRENGNRPGPVSVDYYLTNTLEYIERGGSS